MKDRPIVFSEESIRTILDGLKTHTRRVFPQEYLHDIDHNPFYGPTTVRESIIEPGFYIWQASNNQSVFSARCRYGMPGDRLWVKETWAAHTFQNRLRPSEIPAGSPIFYRADPGINESHYWWRSSRFMPKWASRILLEITSVRVERLQDITTDDILAEGIKRGEDGSWLGSLDGTPDYPFAHAHEAFSSLWDSINSRRGYPWERNPWVFVIEFARIKP